VRNCFKEKGLNEYVWWSNEGSIDALGQVEEWIKSDTGARPLTRILPY